MSSKKQSKTSKISLSRTRFQIQSLLRKLIYTQFTIPMKERQVFSWRQRFAPHWRHCCRRLSLVGRGPRCVFDDASDLNLKNRMERWTYAEQGPISGGSCLHHHKCPTAHRNLNALKSCSNLISPHSLSHSHARMNSTLSNPKTKSLAGLSGEKLATYLLSYTRAWRARV